MRFRSGTGFFLFILGVALATRGTLRGEVWRILTKAIVVCLECVGIG